MIYILEDDTSIRKLVVYTLNSQGMEAEGFERPSRFWSALEERKPELLLLDIMLPEEDGLQILKRLRADPNTRKLPVIMLTAKGTEYDKVLGLDQGADDYIAKPFGMMELMARIRTALRHAGQDGEEKTTYRVGELYVDPSRHIVRDGQREVTLTLKEFQLLCLLLERKGTVFTRDQLLNTIWGYEFDGASRTVDVHIRTLRQKLGDSGNCIETVRGIGYKINGEGA
ncbi:DNA-binding response regulator [Pseudoflavonifractor sp. AF19-9AC]|uniref:response regulator transcription factor n=1 Tax=Pseudoflavonifractor sp. AF19-9AC TaxID=2292244 RepID=UPI000E48C671|nr:response regulator transcription factor [Pseudoflavonifractor sp. AF19-9AC]RHR11146.1 DNA-binding response regulator [Pseudoflavonifractor sp. AF19-9AC]